MKKYIYFLLLVLICTSCSALKKTVTTDTKTDTELTDVKKDSLYKDISIQEIIDKTIDKIDLSDTKITLYSEPDSSGKQFITAVIEQKKDIKTTSVINKKRNKIEKIEAIKEEKIEIKQNVQSIKKAEVEKKGVKWYKYYIWGGITVIFVAALFWLLRKLKIL